MERADALQPRPRDHPAGQSCPGESPGPSASRGRTRAPSSAQGDTAARAESRPAAFLHETQPPLPIKNAPSLTNPQRLPCASGLRLHEGQCTQSLRRRNLPGRCPSRTPGSAGASGGPASESRALPASAVPPSRCSWRAARYVAWSRGTGGPRTAPFCPGAEKACRTEGRLCPGCTLSWVCDHGK